MQVQGWRSLTSEVKKIDSVMENYRESLFCLDRKNFDKFKSEFFDDSYFIGMAKHSEEVVALAGALYLE